MARHAAQWHGLPADDHELLAAQPAPYGPFFALIERTLHDHDPMQMPALLAEIARGEDAEMLAPLLARLSGFIDVEDATDAPAAIAAMILRLRVEAVDDQLKMLAELGDLSDTERTRYQELNALRNALRSRAQTLPPQPA